MSYYESHITLDPVFDERLVEARKICLKHGFRVAELLMQKRREDSPEQSKYDTFASSRSETEFSLKHRMINCIDELKEHRFTLRRYKIEHVVLDSRSGDVLELL